MCSAGPAGCSSILDSGGHGEHGTPILLCCVHALRHPQCALHLKRPVLREKFQGVIAAATHAAAVQRALSAAGIELTAVQRPNGAGRGLGSRPAKCTFHSEIPIE